MKNLKIKKSIKIIIASKRFLNISEQPNIEIEQGDAAVIACRRVLTGSDDDAVNKDRSRNVGDALSSALDGQIIDLIMLYRSIRRDDLAGNNLYVWIAITFLVRLNEVLR